MCVLGKKDAGNMEVEPNYPNTIRFWRLNEIEALNIMTQFKDASLAQTPEEYETMTRNKQRLEELQDQERRILSRFERMTGRDLVNIRFTARKTIRKQNSNDRQELVAEEPELPF